MQLSLKINRASALKALQAYPEALGRAMRLGLKAGLRDVQVDAVRDHRFTSRSGLTDRSIRTEVEGLKGRVFLDTGVSPYGPFLHSGTGVYGPRGQVIRPTSGKLLGPWWYKGRKIYVPFVKGYKGDPFLYRAADRNQAALMSRLNRGIAKVIKTGGA